MDYYQGIVADYLSADPAMFVQSEACIQLRPNAPLVKGEHWYCDVLAVNFREQTAYLCEVTFSKTLQALMRRLRQWDRHWGGICDALRSDKHLPPTWHVRSWVFVPESQRAVLALRVKALSLEGEGTRQMPAPLVTSLEHVVPWRSAPPQLPGPNENGALDG